MSLVLFYACGLSFGRLVIKMYVAKAEPAALSAPQSKTKTTKIYFLFFSPFPLFFPPSFYSFLKKAAGAGKLRARFYYALLFMYTYTLAFTPSSIESLIPGSDLRARLPLFTLPLSLRGPKCYTTTFAFAWRCTALYLYERG